MTAVQMNSGSPPEDSSTLVLETKRLALRAPRLEDAEAIALLANNRKIAEMTELIPHPYRIENAEAWIASLTERSQSTTFALFAKDQGLAFIGACGYGMREETTPEIGYWIGEPFWVRGYATEAVRAMIDHAFTTTDFDALAAGCRVTNLASRRVLEKCGFQWTRADLCRIRAIGASVPSDRFRLDRRIWASLRTWGRTTLPGRARAAKGQGSR
jgi:RimJ/RimL family protein N-acetyltransferase